MRKVKIPIRKTPITRSKTMPISITSGIPNVVVSAAMKIPFSRISRPRICMSALLRLVIRKQPLRIIATAAASGSLATFRSLA